MAMFERRHEGGAKKVDDRRQHAAIDRDRVLYSSAFRRLDGVTQVVGPDEGHVFHNRLTHSMKVGQLARRIAENVCAALDAKDPRRPDPEIAEAAGFAHDLGHPPFGHVAEKRLDERVVEKGLSDGYEGNAQTFRILTKLSVRRSSVPGLNLTREALNAVLKYPWFRTPKEGDKKRHRKWGVYRTERADFEFCREGTPEGARSIEAQCMEFADDIAYSIHDAEDFYRAGLVPMHRFAAIPTKDPDKPLLRSSEAGAFIAATLASMEKKAGLLDEKKKELFASEFDRAFALCPLVGSYVGNVAQRADLRRWASDQIQEFVNAIEPVEKDGRIDLVMPEPLMARIEILKQLMWHYVIDNPRLATQQVGFQHAIDCLFDVYWDAATKNEWRVFPAKIAGLHDKLDLFEGLDDKQRAARLVADTISSMTDREALAMHRRFRGLAPGSILDQTGI